MIRFTSVAALSFVGCLTVSAPLLAQQDPSKSTFEVSSTEFKPLSLWDKVRIGGAYFTDPSYVRSLRIAYGFNSSDIPKDQIDELIKAGKVVPATVNPATGNATAVGGKTQSQASTQGTILLSKSATLLGQSPTTVWMTRDSSNAGGR